MFKFDSFRNKRTPEQMSENCIVPSVKHRGGGVIFYAFEARLQDILIKLRGLCKRKKISFNTGEAYNSFWLLHYWTKFCFATK